MKPGIESLSKNTRLNPPAEIGLSAAQVLLGIDTEIKASQDNIKKQLDDIEASLDDGTAPVTRLRLKTLQTLAKDMVRTVQGPVSELYDQRVEEAPDQVEANNRQGELHWQHQGKGQPPEDVNLGQVPR